MGFCLQRPHPSNLCSVGITGIHHASLSFLYFKNINLHNVCLIFKASFIMLWPKGLSDLLKAYWMLSVKWSVWECRSTFKKSRGKQFYLSSTKLVLFAFSKYCFREKLLRIHPQIFSYRLKNQHKRKRGTQKKSISESPSSLFYQ